MEAGITVEVSMSKDEEQAGGLGVTRMMMMWLSFGVRGCQCGLG